MKKLVTVYVGVLALMLIIVYYLDNTTVDYSAEARAELEARRINCDIGQIPMDCVLRGEPQRFGKRNRQ